jgi:hypothetical protein
VPEVDPIPSATPIGASARRGTVSSSNALTDRSSRRTWRRGAFFGIVLLVLAVLLSISRFVLPAVRRLLADRSLAEIDFDNNVAASVVAQITSGKLKPAPDGIVKLPLPLATASCDGKAYVTIDSSGTTWILFPVWRGKGSNVTGYVYRSPSVKGAAPLTVTLNGPALPPGLGPFAQPLDYTVDSQESPNRYRIHGGPW